MSKHEIALDINIPPCGNKHLPAVQVGHVLRDENHRMIIAEFGKDETEYRPE